MSKAKYISDGYDGRQITLDSKYIVRKRGNKIWNKKQYLEFERCKLFSLGYDRNLAKEPSPKYVWHDCASESEALDLELFGVWSTPLSP